MDYFERGFKIKDISRFEIPKNEIKKWSKMVSNRMLFYACKLKNALLKKLNVFIEI